MNRKRLFIITGTSGSGKTSMVAPLRSMLTASWEVWDIDEIVWNLPAHGHPEVPALTWKPGDSSRPTNVCKNVCLQDAARHPKPVVLCGTLLPQEVFPQTRVLFRSLHWCGLYAAPDAVRTRLAARGWAGDLIEVHARSFTWFSRIPEQVPHHMPMIDTTGRQAEAVAQEIRHWIQDLDGEQHQR